MLFLRSLSTLFATLIVAFATFSVYAQDAVEGAVRPAKNIIVQYFQTGLLWLTEVLERVLFYEIFGFPSLVLWLSFAGVYFTLRLGFVNLRLFGHGVQVARGKFMKEDTKGDVTPFAAMSAAVAGTVGLGNIAGVAVAISLGGPGAVVWMLFAGFLGMSTRFAETVLGHKYRHINDKGNYTGGAFYYLSQGLAEKGMAGFGKFLAVLFAVLCVGGALGGGNMLQSNQLTATVISSFDLQGWKLVISGLTTFFVAIVLIGGVKRIAHVAEAIVPLMALIYMVSGLAILFVNASLIPDALMTMFTLAFDPGAAVGGVVGAIVQGFRRAAFSNEAGVGSTPIIFAATKTEDAAQAGSLAIITPFIDTLVVCFMTGLMIVVTGVYQGTEETGVVLTGMAFSTVADWFPMVLSISVTLFAFTTMLSWSYYGERAWGYLFGTKRVVIYHVVFCALVFFGGAMQDAENEGFNMIVNFSDLLLLSMAVPNMIGVYILQGMVVTSMKDYIRRLKSGEIVPNS